MKIELSDEQWMSLIDGTRNNGLQKCCGNISHMRDLIIMMARDGGECRMYGADFLRAYRAAADGHDLAGISALMVVRDICLVQHGITYDQLMAQDHADRNYEE